MLALIHKDHENIALLLGLLNRNLAELRAEHKIRYDLVRDVVTYLHDYADKHHHPTEDVIYGYYLEKQQPAEHEAVHYLAQEHHRLADVTAELQTLLEMILMDAVVPSDQFINKLSDFIDMQQRHMDYEEDKVLPLLRQTLTAEDWEEIFRRLPYRELGQGESPIELFREVDPLFGNNVAERYRKLHEHMVE